MTRCLVYKPDHPNADELGMVDKAIYQSHPRESSFTFLPDKAGYLSPLDGRYVEGRVAHRDHMKRHDVEELGNERAKPHKFVEMPPAGPIVAEEFKRRGLLG